MRKQVGWYNPKSGGLCMKHDKTSGSGYEAYIVSVFADDTVPMFTDETPPVPECKKPRDENSEDDELMDEICVQTLENQVAMLSALLQLGVNGLTATETRRNVACMRTESVKLLERLKKNEDHCHKS